MTFEILRTGGPLAVVPGLRLPGSFADARRAFPYLPEPAWFVQALNESTGPDGVAVSLDDGKPWIRLFGQRACAGVKVTKRGDALSIEFIEPMTLTNHGRLARSRLRLAPSGWHYYPELHRVPPGYVAPESQIRAAWRQAQPIAGRPATPARYEAFCSALDLVVQGGRQIEAERNPDDRSVPYYQVTAASRARDSAAGVYIFRLSRPGLAQPGAMVHLRHEEDLRGRATEADGELLTVLFEAAVDRGRIPDAGELVVTGNDVVARVQERAVASLRAGTTLNPRLLQLLVDGGFAGYRAGDEQPAEPLDDDQVTAFRRALAVPDLLCVVGPPGTGKTRTIVEVARAAAARGDRVLIASQTNTAVDNVIERLPPSLIAIRVGNEERIARAVQDKTVAAIAARLQQDILSGTQATAERLAPWSGEKPLADGWLRRLDGELAEAAQARGARDEAVTARAAAAAAIESAVGEPARRAEQGWRATAQVASVTAEKARRLAEQLAHEEGRQAGFLGVFHRWRAGRLRPRLAVAAPEAQRARAAADVAKQELDARAAELARAVEADPEVRAAAGRATAAQAEADRHLGLAHRSAQQLVRLIGAVEAVAAPPPDDESVRIFADWCRAWAPALGERARLMAEWRGRLARPSEQLHAELIRYADVIGATCIGVGVQRNLLADLDFDLAVIDEAGQIPMASTVVPMARARRAVLVGDHHQLPPYVDDDVRQWMAGQDFAAAGVDPEMVAELLARSAFERVLRGAPRANQVLLGHQRRMPVVLADFVSAQFYEGKLTSDVKPRPPSPIFRSPLAVIDTSGLPKAERSERQRPRTETWQAAGCDNRAEARIVLDLAEWYTRDHVLDWVVITPYRAQVQLIDLWLRERLGADAVRDRIGTVDAFQGQERDVVLYSFTRSNAAGRVGFLSELRRLNVAITRARRQLVLVGDRSTLTNARDPGFRQLARALFQYAEKHGDVVPSPELRDRLAS